MNQHEALWALAAGCVPDAAPEDIPRIAHQAGFLSSGMWVDPETTWQSGTLAKTKKSLKDTGITLVDVEVIWLEGDVAASDTHKLIVEVGLELGARNVLVVSRHDNHAASVDQFRSICELAGKDIRICLEFGEFTSVKSLKAANAFIDQVGHPAAGILIDLMHLNRAGDPRPSPDELRSSRYPYLQACDFWLASGEMSGIDYIVAAVDDRACLGEGEAHRADLELACGSGKDISLEIRSKALRDSFPDPFTRGEQIFKRCVRSDYC